MSVLRRFYIHECLQYFMVSLYSSPVTVFEYRNIIEGNLTFWWQTFICTHTSKYMYVYISKSTNGKLTWTCVWVCRKCHATSDIQVHCQIHMLMKTHERNTFYKIFKLKHNEREYRVFLELVYIDISLLSL